MDQFLTVSSRILGILAIFSGVYPLVRCARLQWRTSLRHATIWALGTWAAWCAALLAHLAEMPAAPLHYAGLCLTAATVVAVLGARQPGMAAWNFVVAGLLAVLALPLAEQPWRAPNWSLDEPRSIFLAFVLAVGVVNYLPTRWGWAAVAAGIWWGAVLWRLALGWSPNRLSSLAALAAAGWWFAFVRPPRRPRTEIDAVWRDFRDRFGLVWGLRVEEQFNNAARHAGWKATLTWHGLTGDIHDEAQRQEMLRTLRAILQRFTPSA